MDASAGAVVSSVTNASSVKMCLFLSSFTEAERGKRAGERPVLHATKPGEPGQIEDV